MSIHSSLDEIVKYAQGAFIQAKSDGVLEAGEVVQIAVGVAGRLQGLGGQLRGSEKKSVVLYCMKKGLDAAGGIGELPGLKGVSAETRKAVEDQLLSFKAILRSRRTGATQSGLSPWGRPRA